MNNAIQIENLTKTYGSQRGISNLTLAVQTGEIFGYLGPNGAGKTTTIRTLLDFIRPTSGRAEVLGLDSHADSQQIRRRVSYLPGELVLYERMTGTQLLRYFANLRGGVEWKQVQQLAERLELDLKRPIRALSKGNKQKVGLVQAFMGQPELLILDEPTSGLDPLVQQEFYRMAREVRAAGCTVFLSSHLIAEVEHICDRVAIIRSGELVIVDEIESLKQRAMRHFEIHFAQPVPQQVFANVPNIHDLQVHNGVVHCTAEGSVDGLIKTIAQFDVENIISHDSDLEDVFLAYYKEEAAHVA